MLKEYRTVLEGREGEIVEKKSRFIAAVSHAENEEEAVEFIEKIRKKHYNATHNCFAYTIGNRFELQRFSDDGEPGGTAGKPILDVLLGEQIHNTVIVVTRYFGGTLLGTGGLVRAYSHSAKEGLASSIIITKKYAAKLQVRTDYTGLGKIQYILAQKGIKILNTEYAEDVVMFCLVPDDEKENVEKEITEGTNGQAVMEWKESCWYAEKEGEQLLFEK
nr:YigZ family protein [uncultured Sellimonas sp.]